MKKTILFSLLFSLLVLPAPVNGRKVERGYHIISIFETIYREHMQSELSELADAVSDLDLQKVTIQLNSPGGSVTVGNEVLNFMRRVQDRNAILETNIINYAGSMAANIFLYGDVRVMGRNDIILFHQAMMTLDGHDVSSAEMRELVNTGTLRRSQVSGFVAFLKTPEGKTWLRRNIQEMRDEVDDFEAEERYDTERIAERLGKPYEWVIAHVVVPFENREIDGETALKYGIATRLDRS